MKGVIHLVESEVQFCRFKQDFFVSVRKIQFKVDENLNQRTSESSALIVKYVPRKRKQKQRADFTQHSLFS